MSELQARILLNKELYTKVYLIRKAESLIIENYADNGMKTPMHMSMGEEATSAGVCQALGSHGVVVGYYRSHALFLAKTEDTDKFFGELYGKVSGTANGKAGSMHLSSPEHGFVCASAVVASTISVAMGVAFASKARKDNVVVASFFGDGAMDSGAFWESLNFACLRHIPLLFVCEDNDLAVNIYSKERQGFNSMTELVSKYNCVVLEADTTDPEEICLLTSKAIGRMKETGQPCFLRLKCYRYLEHVGVREDFNLGYRSRADFLKWYERDPVLVQRRKLLGLGIKEEEVVAMEKFLDAKALHSIELAKSSGFPDKSELFKGVFCGE